MCAYLASEDLKHRVTRRDFTWRAVIRTNYAALNLQLQQGIAENHCHLFGSTQTFALSWCSLMNDPQALGGAGEGLSPFPPPGYGPGTGGQSP